MRYQLHTIILVAMLGILCGSCSSLSQLKLDKDGYYNFKNHPIRVKAPMLTYERLTILENDSWVDFTSKYGWAADSRYAVQIYPRPDDVRDEKSFYEYIEPALVRHAVKDSVGAGLKNMEVKRTERLRLHSRFAYEVLAVDTQGIKPGKYPPLFPAVIVVTAIYFESRLIVASYLAPIGLRSSDPAEKQIPWDKYKAFIESIEEVSSR